MEYVRPLKTVTPDYNFLLGYHTGVQKKWWHGIKGITFIYMGIMNDPLIGYKGLAINTHLVEDCMYDRFYDECGAEGDFSTYMRDNKDDVFELLNDIVWQYRQEHKKSRKAA